MQAASDRRYGIYPVTGMSKRYYFSHKHVLFFLRVFELMDPFYLKKAKDIIKSCDITLGKTQGTYFLLDEDTHFNK